MTEACLTDMKKWLSLLFLICFSLLLCPPSSNANPVPVEPICSSHISPLNETSVYLKSEDIRANISNEVIERVEYVLKNGDNLSTNISIALPFNTIDSNLPENLILTVNGTKKDYNWSTFQYTNLMGWNTTCSAIIFNLTFNPLEEKKIVANYSRQFFLIEGVRMYHYITETGRFWNKSIEYARFNYRLDTTIGEIYISGLDNYSSSTDGQYLVISKEFYNWTPEQNIVIDFDLGYTPPPPPLLPLLMLGIATGASYAAYLIIRAVQKKNK